MKRIVAITAFLLCLLSAGAREWTAYLSFHNATSTIEVDGTLYTLANGGLFVYTPGDTAVATYSKATGLADTDIAYMAYCEAEDVFVLVYDNANVDILGLNDSITHMTELKNSSLSDKTIYDLIVVGKYAYISTASGIVVVNVARREFANTYDFGAVVRSAAPIGDTLVALTTSGIYMADMDDNLLDPASWTCTNASNYRRLFPLNDDLYIRASSAILKMDITSGRGVTLYRVSTTYASVGDEELFFWNDSLLYVLDADEDTTSYHLPDNDIVYLQRVGDLFYACRGSEGLQAYEVSGDSLIRAGSAITPNSPLRNYTYYLDYTSTDHLLIAGGSLNYTGLHYDGTVMMLADGVWYNVDDDEVTSATGFTFRDVTAVIEDPADPTHHYASAAGGGLYEFRNMQLVDLYTYTNSPLRTLLPDDDEPALYVRTSGLCYDESGNLWMFNNGADTILHVLLATGEWDSYYNSTLAEYPTFDKLLLDSRGWFWGTHRRTTSSHKAGIFCFSNNGTTSTHSDDSWKFVYSFTNQDNTSYTFNTLHDIVEDRNGSLWIATDQGPFLLEDPTTFWNSSTTFKQIIIPRNDGTNYGDYLLTGVPILSIAIDGANRKWFGTNGYGAYLISDDGLETVEHFTATNSPLLSNIVYDIAINPTTGDVYFATDAGLIAYRSDATEPEEELAEDNLLIYPNPVSPTFTGKVRIDGLTENSDVKITTVTGQVVAQGTSLGGTFTWDLRDMRGRHVSSGVYYVIAANEDGSEGVAGKFVVIK